jgi:hypothetical protein
MNKVRCVLLLALLAAVFAPSAARAQVRITGGITGTVTDPSDAVIPGATVQLRDEGTGQTKETVTNQGGVFQFPDLNSGRYTVTVTLNGFTTAKYEKVVVEASRSTDLRVKLASDRWAKPSPSRLGLGARDDAEHDLTTIGRTQVTQPRSPAVTLPGARSARRRRPARRHQRHGGPERQHALQRHAGRHHQPDDRRRQQLVQRVQERRHEFLRHRPGAARRGGGSHRRVRRTRRRCRRRRRRQPEFVRRRHQQLTTAARSDQAQNDTFNANCISVISRGIQKAKLRRHDFGFNFGGPLVPAGTWREKLFIFVNLEEQYIPATQTRSQTILTPEAEQGIFRYQTAAGEQRTVNVFDIAAANGQPSAKDPLVAAILAKQTSARSPARPDEQPPHGHPVVAPAADQRLLLPHRADGLSDLSEALVDGQLESVSPGSARAPELALPRLPDPARHVPQFVVDHLDRVQLAADQPDVQRVPLWGATQRRHDAAP